MCTDVFTWKDAVANISINPKIVHSLADQQIPHYENPIRFSLENIPPSPGVDAFLWNFGDPPSGPQNFNDITHVPEHTFSLGPHLISLRIRVGPCDVTLLDTIQILGPQALIEKPYNRIDFSEKFQCGTDDSVHFTNNSTFYHNDKHQSEEDSFLVVNGKELLAFNYTLPPGRGGAGTGDQRSLASAAHKANRTLGSQVWRIWDFGYPYAAKCTTSMAKGINVGVNCNWSEDEFPVHKYQSWDSVYYNLYYMTNEKFAFTKYNETTNSCYIEMIDTLSPIVHRRIFDKTIPHKYTAKLWLRDTINHIESSDEILIDQT